MKTVQDAAVNSAKVRDSKNKDLIPVLPLPMGVVSQLARIHEDYPYDKEKVCRIIITDDENGNLLGTLGFRIAFVDSKIKNKCLKIKADIITTEEKYDSVEKGDDE